ncbi:iron-sulfur-binding ferredoxin reductase [Pseudomonas mangiferae]|uniref:Iron-sulfur-binding ferredoxin reductase n=1 Tax=Pseudomonas mangiferae TaxID=2593654 RepID=A0A553H0Z8_9PSED|nr:iron-sulfur-binding ferredoxin reductase [Pseudomonas mangiferae]TRX75401.1 iron-sulfur-binding ferredoxin reductase [Pseudomonas mangiferae]
MSVSDDSPADPGWPRLAVGARRWPVAPGTLLLDALNRAGLGIPYSCRAGACQACLVQCLEGMPEDVLPGLPDPARRAAGWRLACQCRVVGDLRVADHDPARDGLPAQVLAVDWLAPSVLRLRLRPQRPLRYAAGQHLLVWNDEGQARPYSLASLPGEDDRLEFHLDCRHDGGFTRRARLLRPGDTLRVGPPLGGGLRYEADWQDAPLWLLAAGAGLAPLWSVLREALRQGHRGPIRLLHLARPGEHYLGEPLRQLAASHPHVQVELPETDALQTVLAGLRIVPRPTRALLCGSLAFVDDLSRRLYMAGLPRTQLLTEAFLPRVE